LAKAIFNKKKTLHQQTGLHFKEETSKSATFGAQLCKVLKLRHFRKQIRDTWKVLKFGAERRMETIKWTDCVRNE
jgi:hypothetical protein